jgi:glyoxylase-like metal-dependent hydrolase (beta-lactamase superfamily II)
LTNLAIANIVTPILSADIAMQPTVTPFFHQPTGTWSYVVADPATREAAVIDPVLDYEWRSGRTGTASADAILAHLAAEGLTLRWILETHAHADHLSSAPHLQAKAGGLIAIGMGIRQVQATFKRVFGLGDEFVPDGRQFDRLLADGETVEFGGITGCVIPTPGHTNDSVSYLFGDALFVGDTIFMPDGGSARCDFPGGDPAELYRSIQRLYQLPSETRVFVCHDYSPGGREPRCETTVGAAARVEHPRAGGHGRAGVHRHAPCARRHARHAEPDPALGAGQHPRRTLAATGVRRRELPQGAAQRRRPPALNTPSTLITDPPPCTTTPTSPTPPRAGPRLAHQRRDPARGRPRAQ